MKPADGNVHIFYVFWQTCIFTCVPFNAVPFPENNREAWPSVKPRPL